VTKTRSTDTANAVHQYSSLITNNSITNNPTYDNSGNTLTMNGAVHTYDQKNQLKSISGLDSNGTMVTVTQSYDPMGRRISSTKNNQTTLYAYDGRNVVEEYSTLNFQTFDLKTILTWGLDLSGTAQGAGGVGGLLFTEDVINNTAWPHHYDGNGNVTHLTSPATPPAIGQLVATYTYDAFGNTVTANGNAAAANKYRFSTKPIDETIASTPLYYYGYGFYNPLTGRWINRDPIEEKGGLNLYGFVENDGVNEFDVLGLIYAREKGDCTCNDNSKCGEVNEVALGLDEDKAKAAVLIEAEEACMKNKCSSGCCLYSGKITFF
jgi:RHS repeat-associated protein